MWDIEQADKDRDAAILWARNLLQRQDWCILDSETTGLTETSEIVQLAIVAPDGAVLFDSYINPTYSIPVDATAIHGITWETVREAPRFRDVVEQVNDVLRDRDVVVYNAAFDAQMLKQTAQFSRHHDSPRLLGNIRWSCAMELYAQFVGEWNDYFGNYRWQKLPNGDHTAVGDCRATLQLIHRMAAAETSEERPGRPAPSTRPLKHWDKLPALAPHMRHAIDCAYRDFIAYFKREGRHVFSFYPNVAIGLIRGHLQDIPNYQSYPSESGWQWLYTVAVGCDAALKAGHSAGEQAILKRSDEVRSPYHYDYSDEMLQEDCGAAWEVYAATANIDPILPDGYKAWFTQGFEEGWNDAELYDDDDED